MAAMATATMARRCRWPRRWSRSAPCWCIGIGALAGDVGDAGRARSAADAAALAGVEGGRAGGGAAWRPRNGATLVAWQGDGADVVVTVRVGRADGDGPGDGRVTTVSRDRALSRRAPVAAGALAYTGPS